MVAAVPGDHPLLVEAKDRGIEVVFAEEPIDVSEDGLIKLFAGATATIAGVEDYSRRVLEATSLMVNSRAVADHAFALLLALGRSLFSMDAALRQQRWPRPPQGADIYGMTLGVIGMGRIGKEVIKRASGFSMRVIATDPVWDEEFAGKYGVERTELANLFRQADYVTLHLPSNKETFRIVNAERLAMMKPTAFLINTARGPLVDESALVQALRERRIAGAGLDAFEKEPLGASPLLELDNVILTPHSAYFSPTSNEATVRTALENALAVLAGKRPWHCVNEEVLGAE